jgi:predicted ribonuclease toxin of YeeF-YezG toxin-antitoxin module
VSVKPDKLTFAIDEAGRTKVVEGTLGDKDSGRSKRLQRQAGGPDRRVTDDGGHFIAPRFGGPKETYNHFAQNANFNRGAYRALEDKWAKAQKNGEPVNVRIDTDHVGNDQRPDSITVSWTVSGTRRKLTFKNQPGGRSE